jgi:hypothetical protein
MMDLDELAGKIGVSIMTQDDVNELIDKTFALGTVIATIRTTYVIAVNSLSEMVDDMKEKGFPQDAIETVERDIKALRRSKNEVLDAVMEHESGRKNDEEYKIVEDE